MMACLEGHEHVVEALLRGGVTVDMQDEVIPVINSSGSSPLHYIYKEVGMVCQKVCKQGEDDIKLKLNIQSSIPASF